MIKLFLPFPPSINHYYVRTHGTRLALGKAGREHREATWDAVSVCHERKQLPMFGRLGVRAVFYAPNRRVYDLDNRVKCLLDSLQHAGAYMNDSQIDILIALRGEPSKELPGVKVELWDIENEISPDFPLDI